MTTEPKRFLIVNADDRGLSPGINRGFIECHQNGIVSSASLMVRYPAAAEAAELARQHPSLSVGLHLDLGEWEYKDEWVPKYQVVDESDAAAVLKEVTAQLEKFEELTGRGPTH